MKIPRLDSRDKQFPARFRALKAPPPAQESVRERVADIIAKVRREGDRAVLQFARELDGASDAKTVSDLQVSEDELQAAENNIPPKLRDALRFAAQRIAFYHEKQKPESREWTDKHGTVLGEKIVPVSRAVVYAPGGGAAYPSSVLMGAIPANIAGVGEVVACSPGAGDATLAAANIAGASRVWRVGGAHAIAAFALGTESVPRADVVAGPGGAFVTEAKRQLFGEAGFDLLAGPSEVFIIASAGANPEWIAADLVAQAEHDALARCVLATPDSELADSVFAQLQSQAESAPRAKTICAALQNRGALITTRNLNECADLANDFAPEHLQLMGSAAEELAPEIRNAGAMFIGESSCVPLGDYCAGTNHILPTTGGARFSSPLGVRDFTRRMEVVRATPAGAGALAESAAALAEAEGLPAHAASARLRGRI